ncbi:apyrase [Lucilia sericata]|uniref:apyrase n=1 Tax=Lucilia sericata TaxID=13632 RepID=UPI0018A88143|nr:apyrase [Lucilia sericata]
MNNYLFNANHKNTATTSFASASTSTPHQQYSYRELNSHNSTPRTSHQRPGMYSRDWRSALRTPPTYRIGNRTVRFNYHIAMLIAGVCALFILFYYVRGSTSSSDAAWLKNYASSTSGHRVGASSSSSIINSKAIVEDEFSSYNSTYPLTQPIVGRPGMITFRIAMVADLDTNSKVENNGATLWRSYLKKGHLTYITSKDEITINWDSGEPSVLESSFSLKGRGMELSEIVTFNGKLLSFDDRTGLVYDITNTDKPPIPWIILLDGNGHSAKGFKSEWATVKDRLLYVGSMGKEWTTGTGEFENENPMFVKVVTPAGSVRSLDWSYNFKRLRQESSQISWPGYMIHESGVWSSVHRKWFFLPRRCSKEKYNETRDEHMGCNLLISADEDFNKIETVPLDSANTQTTHGFSSFKFIPGTDDRIIVALKTEELNGKTTTFITAFDIHGKTLYAEQHIETELKYEGFEFI